MKRLTVVAVWALAVGIILLLVVRGRVTLSDVRRTLDVETPPGSPVERVCAVVERFGGECGPIKDTEAGSGDFKGPTRIMQAVIRGARVRVASPFSDGIFIEAEFDASDRLIRYVASYGYTMP